MNTPIKYELNNGITEYRLLNGSLHRTDGPAMIFSSGEMGWYLFGKLHRVNGPAVYGLSGITIWYSHGLRHRIDGPAVVHANGAVEYWINDTQLDPVTFLIEAYEHTNKI